MEFVPRIFGRMADKGMELDRHTEWSAAKELLSRDKEAYVLRSRFWKLMFRQRNYVFYRYIIRWAREESELVKETETLFMGLDAEIGEKERAPLLAQLELEMGSRTMQDEEWMAVVETYWTRWGSKGCVVSELEGVIGEDEERLGRVLDMMRRRVTHGHVGLH